MILYDNLTRYLYIIKPALFNMNRYYIVTGTLFLYNKIYTYRLLVFVELKVSIIFEVHEFKTKFDRVTET